MATLPEHLFLSSDGDLHDTRMADWSHHPIRTKYAYHFGQISNTRQLRACLRAGPFAWPGGYACYFIASDGAALPFAAVRAEYRQVSNAIKHLLADGWRVVGMGCTADCDAEIYCDHTGERIE